MPASALLRKMQAFSGALPPVFSIRAWPYASKVQRFNVGLLGASIVIPVQELYARMQWFGVGLPPCVERAKTQLFNGGAPPVKATPPTLIVKPSITAPEGTSVSERTP